MRLFINGELVLHNVTVQRKQRHRRGSAPSSHVDRIRRGHRWSRRLGLEAGLVGGGGILVAKCMSLSHRQMLKAKESKQKD